MIQSNQHSGVYAVDVNNGFKRIEAKVGTSLLVALAKGEIFMPSACGGQGKCGFCRLKVNTHPGTPPNSAELSHLSAEEQAQGFRLACQTKPDGDVSVEIPASYFGARRYTGKVISKVLLTHDTAGLRIALPPGKAIHFTAGQYVQVRSPAYGDKGPVLRAYSISTPPSVTGEIGLMVKRVPNGTCSVWVLDHLQEGMDVQFTGPYGAVALSESTDPILFIAGGSGVAPVWCMAQQMLEQGIRRKARFFFGALTQRDLYLVDELRQMERDLPGFMFIPALSNEPVDSGWTGERGLITEVVDRHCPDCTGLEAYVCGSPGMTNACLAVLTKNGMTREKIFFDKF